MQSYNFLLDIALILLSTKVFGLITKKFHMPQVVGALLAGLILGPAMLGVITETDFLNQVSELGVIVLMFSAGLETDVKELKKTGLASFVIALIGVIVPLVGGFFLALAFNKTIPSDATTPLFLQNIFIGVILTATSVSITVETLKEMGRLNTHAGNAILGAAVIDDILGVVALTIVTSSADPSVNIFSVLFKIVLFFVFAVASGFVFYMFFKWWTGKADHDLRRFVIVAFVFCLLLSYVAEEWFGVADITGAYIAGLVIANTQRTKYVASRFGTLSYILLSPVFFASIGLKVELPNMTASIIIFAVLLVVIAVLTKVVGCGFGAKMMKFSGQESIQIGVGMISRGEVALIVANKGNAVGLMSTNLFGPVVIMVVVTTIITPILLKVVFSSKHAGVDSEPVQNGLADSYEELEALYTAKNPKIEEYIKEQQSKHK